MKLAFSTLGCPEWDIEKVAEKAVEYGFDGVELRARGKQHVDIDFDNSERLYVRKLFENKNLTICCLSGYTFFGEKIIGSIDEKINSTLRLIDLAADLNAQAIRVFAEKPDNMDIDEAAGNIADAVNRCGRYAEEKNVAILLETHHRFSSGKNMRKIMNKVAFNKSVGVIWDIHHTLSESELPEDTFSLIGSHIRHIHIKDAIHNQNGDDRICLTGKGSLTIKSIIALLKERDYEGFFSFEWEKMWIKELEEPEKAFPQFIDYMRSL